MMHHDPIFAEFESVEVEADGASVYDFLGVSTHARFKKGWSKFVPPAGKKFSAKLPVLNEHYLDWVVVLESVACARGTYRVVELGAGWGSWSSVALAACRQKEVIRSVEAVAIEADYTHWQWMEEHFRANRLLDHGVELLHGAIAAQSGEVSFPVIENPDEDYGASTRNVVASPKNVTVKAYTIEDILDQLSGPADFMHIDIQGAEYDTVPNSLDALSEKVKSVLVGTHISADHHRSMVNLFEDAGWHIRMNYERGRFSQTPYGPIQIGDGVMVAKNPKFS